MPVIHRASGRRISRVAPRHPYLLMAACTEVQLTVGEASLNGPASLGCGTCACVDMKGVEPSLDGISGRCLYHWATYPLVQVPPVGFEPTRN